MQQTFTIDGPTLDKLLNNPNAADYSIETVCSIGKLSFNKVKYPYNHVVEQTSVVSRTAARNTLLITWETIDNVASRNVTYIGEEDSELHRLLVQYTTVQYAVLLTEVYEKLAKSGVEPMVYGNCNETPKVTYFDNFYWFRFPSCNITYDRVSDRIGIFQSSPDDVEDLIINVPIWRSDATAAYTSLKGKLKVLEPDSN